FGNVVTSTMMIPPQASHFTLQVYCPKECTNKMPHQITVFASLLHSHLTGVSIWTQIIRDGKEIGYLDSNFNYDFDFQYFVIPSETVIIQPGDEIIFNCQNKKEGRTDYTLGGQSTR
ncbi:hypothetical protein, partial [Salmonella sp. s51228]|uniref:monooxygenase n=1 Tax=Salmonella sp. s51228 TaxID=3159652 RepID=UPI00398019F5